MVLLTCCNTTRHHLFKRKPSPIKSVVVGSDKPVLKTSQDSISISNVEDVSSLSMNKSLSTTKRNRNKVLIKVNLDRSTQSIHRNMPSFDSLVTLGSTVYSIPENMEVRNQYAVFVKISKSKIFIQQSFSDKTVRKSVIPVTENMEVNLIDNSPEDNKAFSIVKENTSEQFLSNDSSFTEWNWTVTPLNSGEHKLSIVISIIRNGVNKEQVFEDTILVKSNFKNQSSFLFKKYWQWLISTLIIPFIIFIFKRRKKNNNDKN